MEKHAVISTAAIGARNIERLRENADTLDGILSGVYSALSQRRDIAPEILQLLALGAARAESLADDLAALKRPVLVNG